jgi:hypothetical protein
LSNPVKEHLADIMKEKQLYWYDHPMEMGVCSENSEFLYGLKGFDEALRFERERGNAAFKARPVMLMSVSVTHKGLQDISASYLEGSLKTRIALIILISVSSLKRIHRR